MFNMFSGGALERLSIFALGVMPYISASIIVQMAGMVIPQLSQLRKEGESGRRKLTQYTRFGTVGLALVQSVGAAVALQNQSVVINPGPSFVFTAAITLVTGTMFLMWLGEQITERGLGNGISMIILASIISGLPAAIGGTLELGEYRRDEPGHRAHPRLAGDRGYRLRGVHGTRSATDHGQLCAPAAGPQGLCRPVQPPAVQDQHVGRDPADLCLQHHPVSGDHRRLVWYDQQGFGWLQTLSAELSPGQPIYILLYAGMIMFFCFFYTALVFQLP